MTYLKRAVATELAERNVAVVTEYSLFILTTKIIRDRNYKGEPISPFPKSWDRWKCSRLATSLEKSKALVADNDFSGRVWRVMAAKAANTAEEACCLVDPFCYVSHLSAMQHYGLTNRNPTHLCISTPSRLIWNELRDAKIQREIPSAWSLAPIAPLTRISFGPKVRRRPIELHETMHPANLIEIKPTGGRISNIGSTFADMLDNPSLCGGMRHVMDVWEDHATSWLDDIIEAISVHPKKIVKVRAGYILEEKQKISDQRIDLWRAFAQRGSSRKLDPDSPYMPKWSENWMISLNV